MLKFFVFIFQIILIILIVSIVINNSFIISFELEDLIYSIDSVYLFLLGIIFFIIIFFIQSGYFKSKNKFQKYKIQKFFKNKEKGYDAFVSGMIALSNKDYKSANLATKKTSNYLDDNAPLSLLLKSEIYKVEKKHNDLNLVYEEMMKHERTENLAFRGFMEQYIKLQDYHHALIYGLKLFKKNPYIEKIYDALVEIIVKTSNWQQLIAITNESYEKKIIDKKFFLENKSIALFEIAKIKQHSELKESIRLIEKAIKLRVNFPPYIIFYLELLIKDRNFNQARKYLKKYWYENPHPDLKKILKELAFHLNLKPLELAKYTTVSNHDKDESKVLLAEAAIMSKEWDIARNFIVDLLKFQPKKEVCLLMALIEEGETGDIQKINSWNMRAQNGEQNKIWVCLVSKESQNEWNSISNAGHFNSLEWRQPYMLNQYMNHKNSISYENR